MTEEELNLLQLAAIHMAELGARSAQMPHAAFTPLCRMPDYAESPVYQWAGEVFVTPDAA